MDMDSITSAEVKKIAGLARLELSSEGVAQATSDLSGILSNFSAIQGIDTTGVKTTDNVSGLQNVARIDEEKPEVLAPTEVLVENVPHTKDNYVQVGGVFSEGEDS